MLEDGGYPLRIQGHIAPLTMSTQIGRLLTHSHPSFRQIIIPTWIQFVPGDFNQVDQNFVNANCAVTSFPQSGENQQNMLKREKPSYHEGLQPYSTLHICWTYFHITSDVKRHKTQAFPKPLQIKLCFTSKKIYPSSMSTMKILAKVDKHPLCELRINFIVPFFSPSTIGW